EGVRALLRGVARTDDGVAVRFLELDLLNVARGIARLVNAHEARRRRRPLRRVIAGGTRRGPPSEDDPGDQHERESGSIEDAQHGLLVLSEAKHERDQGQYGTTRPTKPVNRAGGRRAAAASSRTRASIALSQGRERSLDPYGSGRLA